MTSTTHRVFVYGTLKRGFVNHSLLPAGAAYAGGARTRDPFPLVVAGRWFTPVMVPEPGSGYQIIGEVYAVTNEGLAELDRLEGVEPALGFHRLEVRLVDQSGHDAGAAWAYVRRRDDLDQIHSPPVGEYLPDERYVPAHRRFTGEVR